MENKANDIKKLKDKNISIDYEEIIDELLTDIETDLYTMDQNIAVIRHKTEITKDLIYGFVVDYMPLRDVDEALNQKPLDELEYLDYMTARELLDELQELNRII